MRWWGLASAITASLGSIVLLSIVGTFLFSDFTLTYLGLWLVLMANAVLYDVCLTFVRWVREQQGRPGPTVD